MSDRLREALDAWESFDASYPGKAAPEQRIIVAAAHRLLEAEEQGYCLTHKSTANPVVFKGEVLNLWAGCHDSLWTFASGQGVDAEGNPTIGRCHLVPAKLLVDPQEGDG